MPVHRTRSSRRTRIEAKQAAVQQPKGAKPATPAKSTNPIPSTLAPVSVQGGKHRRTPNSFICYRSSVVHGLGVLSLGTRQQHLSRTIGESWNQMTAEEQEPFARQAMKLKEDLKLELAQKKQPFPPTDELISSPIHARNGDPTKVRKGSYHKAACKGKNKPEDPNFKPQDASYYRPEPQSVKPASNESGHYPCLDKDANLKIQARYTPTSYYRTELLRQSVNPRTSKFTLLSSNQPEHYPCLDMSDDVGFCGNAAPAESDLGNGRIEVKFEHCFAALKIYDDLAREQVSCKEIPLPEENDMFDEFIDYPAEG
ncbi:hypothetical protein C8R44DRAFT_743920 [Mycena epipterygia]|nr:hypothetical protein C8R44DRAFT_743920 [Mycena epipterygia]